MKISIVIPVYNVKEYLEQCIQSVRKITSEIEILLIDDGSTDGSDILCDELAKTDYRIQVIHQKNGGLSAARNTGILNSTGDYILFLDSDDFVDPIQTDKMLSLLNDDTLVLTGLYNKFYTEDSHIEPELNQPYLDMEGTVPIEQFLKQVNAYSNSCYMTAWRFVCSRKLLLNNNLLFLPGIYHEDEEWTSRLFSCIPNITVSCSYFYQYRQARNDSIMATVSLKHILDCFTIIHRMDDLQKNTQQDIKKYLCKRMGMLYMNNLAHFGEFNSKERDKIMPLLQQYCDLCIPFMDGILGYSTYISIKILGLRPTCCLLNIAKKIKHLVHNMKK